ncbi:hypothetical protein [Amycolatopsis cihanbeyliensis]|uniref:J domain-containing protein n=1 Tax=Amycolatopsis cihanbeyliensis TaxID=1128664 RepID=A0A542DD75_AMYCI|nr:hypothetical protein [Amycolatopsis cihanbeyliensis]TQJ01018.1 hypothetical protein FB471_0680 [Amycolatopsis cihanbeyliensis]
MNDVPDRSAEGRAARAAFRAFVRENHPDVGGDPHVFAEGLDRFRRGEQPENQQDQPEDDSRYDAPVVFVKEPGGVTGLTNRVKRWRGRKRRPPRVR